MKDIIHDLPNKAEINILIDQTVSIVGDKWSLHLIGVLAFGKSPIRFNELLRVLKPISSRTLSIKLAKLVEHGIIAKKIENASPPYTTYSLTQKGRDLIGALNAMAEWYQKWYGRLPSVPQITDTLQSK